MTPLPWHRHCYLAQPPDGQRDNAIPALKALVLHHTKQMRAIPTPLMPTGQEEGFIGIQDTPSTIMPGRPFRKRRVVEIPLYRAATAAYLLRDGIEGPSLPMIPPDLMILDPAAGPSLAG
jgi:hypothetical protein